MKKLLLSLLLVIPGALAAQNASIEFDIDRVKGEIDSNIYGVFMEPIGRGKGNNTLYGPLYNPESPIANEDGFKMDYIDAMRELKITNMRWPGGNYCAAYNWQDGIGPKENRPVRYEPAWGGYDTNQVGTDEWVALNRAIGSQNVACLNLGLGTVDNARYWIEYCNIPEGTYFSDLRIKNGSKEPHNIKIWCLGNEVDASRWIMGFKNEEDYVKTAREAAKALRAVDRTVKLVANGSSFYESGQNVQGAWVDWNRAIIAGLAGVADYLSIHRYWEVGDEENHYSFFGDNSMDMEEKINVVQGLINAEFVAHPQRRPMYISVDEWGPHGRGFQGPLGAAMYLNAFIRHSDIVKMSNYTMMTRLLDTDRESGKTFKAPMFHLFKLYSNYCHGKTVDSFVQCDTYDGNIYKNIPYLDVSVVHSEADNMIYVNVVNIHKDNAITTDIIGLSGTLDKKAEVRTVCHEMDATFTIDKEAEYVPVVSSVNVKDNKLTYSFPAHSFTQIAIPLK